MKRTALFLVSLLLASCAQAPPRRSADWQRRFQALVAKAMAEGKDISVPRSVVEDIGFTESITARQIVQEFQITPRTNGERIFEVVLSAKSEPVSAIFGYAEVRKDDEGEHFRGWSFRTDLSGELMYAASFSGFSGSVVQESISIRNPKTRQHYDSVVEHFIPNDL
ncbi:MAG: hypothetical protein HY078_16585 [Elusimicrobia bacterium]|nr:hypothetical protein [Elusimicrobiota bacterium]